MTSGDLFELVRLDGPLSRGEVGRISGLSRTTVTARVDQLLAADLLVEQPGTSTRGRPPAQLAWNPAAGNALAIDLDRTSARLAITDLAGHLLAETCVPVEITDGPRSVLESLIAPTSDLMHDLGGSVDNIWGVGLGVPSPVDRETGRLIQPAGMPGWAEVSLPDIIAEHLAVPVVVDNDVRMMAIAEAAARWPGQPANLMFIKLGTGVGGALLSDGAPVRGARGVAGDIGHVPVNGSRRLCHCGNEGCLETIASGWAILERLQASGHAATSLEDVVALVHEGVGDALQAVRAAGRALGELLSTLVNVLNPGALVFGGDLAAVDEALLAGVRELVYKRATPLAGREVLIATSQLGSRAGVLGAARAALDAVLNAATVDQVLEDRAEGAA